MQTISMPNWLSHDMVEANLTAAAEQQKTAYNERASPRTLRVGNLVWLEVQTARKLNPRWKTGRFELSRAPLTLNSQMASVLKWCISTMYIIASCQAQERSSQQSPSMASWHPLAVDQMVLPLPCSTTPYQPPQHYHEWDRRPRDRFGSLGTSFI